MTIRFAAPTEIDTWNEHVLANPDGGNIFQSIEFTQQKRMGGWTPRYLVADKVAITVLEKSVFGLGRIWYAPKGPGINNVRQLDSFLSDLKTFAAKNSVFVVKIEPELPKAPETTADLLKLGLVKVAPIQPNYSTVTLDLHGSIDEILAGLNQKGRHAIKRAERDGVTISKVPSTDENCKLMYSLLAETARGSFRVRSYDYYKAFWQRYSDSGLGQLFFAYFEGAIVAGAYAITFGKKSIYKDGASIRERTAYGASHLLQWHVIKWAKDKGSLIHDLCGAPPSDQINNPDHPYYGIGRFKTSFNKHVTDYIGTYDIVVKNAQYKLWSTTGERTVMRLHSRTHNENYY